VKDALGVNNLRFQLLKRVFKSAPHEFMIA
jgi:hypothetical protein